MDQPRAQRITPAELELRDLKVTREGGSLRYLEGARYGLRSSIYRAEVVPGGGPDPHRHPYDEIFCVEQGQVRFQVGSTFIDAEAGDIVIVRANAPHGFVNSGTGMLRHVAIHDGAARVIREPAVLDE